MPRIAPIVSHPRAPWLEARTGGTLPKPASSHSRRKEIDFGGRVAAAILRWLLEQKARDTGRSRINSHVRLHGHDHPVHAGRLGRIRWWISRDDRKRCFPDERRSSASGVVLSAEA